MGYPLEYLSPLSPETEHALESSRIILLMEEITDRTATVVIAKILAMQAKSETEHIKIYMKTPGGLCSAGWSIIDAISLCKCPVDIYAIGDVCSMGIPIMAAATGRKYSYPNARFMYHEASGGCTGKTSDVVAEGQELASRQKTIVEYLRKKTKIPNDILMNGKIDTWFGAEGALIFGLIDEIMK